MSYTFCTVREYHCSLNNKALYAVLHPKGIERLRYFRTRVKRQFLRSTDHPSLSKRGNSTQMSVLSNFYLPQRTPPSSKHQQQSVISAQIVSHFRRILRMGFCHHVP